MPAEQVGEKNRPREVQGEPQDGDGQTDRRSDDRHSDKVAEDKASAKQDEEAKQRRRPVVFVVLGLLAIGGLYYWLSTRNIESTDDGI